jgi:hypothetical protein
MMKRTDATCTSRPVADRGGAARHRLRRGFRAILLAILTVGGGGAAPAAAQVTREYDLKAVFLYNLASFVEWPVTAFSGPDAPFIIGVLGQDPFGAVLDGIVANEYVDKHPFVVRRFRRGEDVSECHLLFVAESESRRLPEVLRSLRGRPVLTVGDRPGFIEAGGMIGFATRADHLQLFVNRTAVHAAQLVVSSKLLEVAQVVETLAMTP